MAVIKRNDLIKLVSEKIDRRYPQQEIYWIVQATFRCFEDILKNGDTLKVKNCFTLKKKIIKGRKYNSNGEKYYIKEHYIPHFVPSKILKEACLSLPVEEVNKDEEDTNDE